MSYRELAKTLIDQIPDSKMYYVVAFLQGVSIPEEAPNAETLKAMVEIGEMIRTEIGQHFQGSAEKFTNMLLSEH